MVTAPQPARLTDIRGALKRHWSIIAATGLIGLLLGLGAYVAIPATYTATATVAVNPIEADLSAATAAAGSSLNMATEEGIIGSRTVAAAASELLRPRFDLSAAQIKDALDVSAPDDSQLVDIEFEGSSDREAAAGADAVAEAYLTTRREQTAAEIDRQVKAATAQVTDVQQKSTQAAFASAIAQRSLQVQADSLGRTLAQLGTVDLDPGRVIGTAETPTDRSSPSLLSLGLIGLLIGALVGIPLALMRKEVNSEIGIDGLSAIGDQIVLDGTKDHNRADTWDIAAFMLKIPTELDVDGPFTIMVDAQSGNGRSTMPGQELVDALSRRGRSARYVDAGAINEGKISRGWPTDKKRISWGGEIIVIDTTHLTSDANKVALATRSDSVLLARSTADDAAALRRLAGLLKSKNVDIALTALFPARHEMITLAR